jgi:hypothetical protein
MQRIEAYNILRKMYDEATEERRAAISIAMNDIEFVGLMPKDMARVVFCSECKFNGDEDDCPLLSMAAHIEPTDHCSYGERKDGDGDEA